jgi:hypothetical protein
MRRVLAKLPLLFQQGQRLASIGHLGSPGIRFGGVGGQFEQCFGKFVRLAVRHAQAAGSQRDQAHIMPLLDETVDRSAHAGDGILRLGAENQAALRIRPRPLGAVGVILVRLAARPAGDRVLELVEDADVELVGRALLGKQIGQAVLIVVLINELQNRPLES